MPDTGEFPAWLNGRVTSTDAGSAVVTGGARGIGRAIAERLVARGHRVVIGDIDGDVAAATAAEIGASSGVAMDVRDPRSHDLVAAEAARHGVLRAWFNNAGVGDDGQLAELEEEQVRRLVEVNLLGCAWGTRTALAAFGSGGGDIVNTASVAGLGAVPGYSVYAATKAAVVSLTMSVDAESPKGVRVHAVCPDGVDTALLAGQDPTRMGSQLVHSGGRILTPEEVAEAAVGLLGSRRVVRTVPTWRGALMRGGALAPSLSGGSYALFAAQGRRAQRKRG